MRLDGTTIGLVGALAAFPRRLAARNVERQGGQLRRGITRHTSRVVFGRGLLGRDDENAIERLRIEVLNAHARPLSETGFLRLLGMARAAGDAGLMRQALLDQSGLAPAVFDLLALFDAFEHDSEPFSFRDLILAKKYAGLVAAGAGWGAIARSIHRLGAVTSLTALSLEADGGEAIYARHGNTRAEPDDALLEAYFAAAEDSEAVGRFETAAVLYARALALDPGDSIAAYNRANCLRELGETDEAALAYAQALKLDPGLVEAWFNYAGLLRATGRIDVARTHLARAIALDPDYGDAVYNLATLEYDAGDLTAAR